MEEKGETKRQNSTSGQRGNGKKTKPEQISNALEGLPLRIYPVKPYGQTSPSHPQNKRN
jgi:hypothetical protein